MMRNFLVIIGLLVLSVDSHSALQEGDVIVRESRGPIPRFIAWVTSCYAPNHDVVAEAMAAQPQPTPEARSSVPAEPPRPTTLTREEAVSRPARGDSAVPASVPSSIDSRARTASLSAAASIAGTYRSGAGESRELSVRDLSHGSPARPHNPSQADQAVAAAMLEAPSHHTEATDEWEDDPACGGRSNGRRAHAIGSESNSTAPIEEEEEEDRKSQRHRSKRRILRSDASKRAIAAALTGARDIPIENVYGLLGEEEPEQARLASGILRTPCRALRVMHPDWSDDQIQAALGNEAAIRRLHPGWSNARIRQFIRNTTVPISAAAVAALEGDEEYTPDFETPRGLDDDEDEEDPKEEELTDSASRAYTGVQPTAVPEAWRDLPALERARRFAHAAGGFQERPVLRLRAAALPRAASGGELENDDDEFPGGAMPAGPETASAESLFAHPAGGPVAAPTAVAAYAAEAKAHSDQQEETLASRSSRGAFSEGVPLFIQMILTTVI